MAKIKIQSTTKTYIADQANGAYQLAVGRTIDATGNGMEVFGAAAGRTLKIDGKVTGGDHGIAIGESGGSNAPVTVTIGKSGHVVGGDDGINSLGIGGTIDNAGKISGTLGDGISLMGGQTIVNSGTIIGYNAINVFSTGEETTIRNSGILNGRDAGRAIYGSGGDETVINSGIIHGKVSLGDGGDTFVFRSGKLDGVLEGGDGNERYIVHKAGLEIVEQDNQGYDSVQSSVSFELSAFVENLALMGKKDIDATGNGGNNELSGNAGRNHISGWYGNDHINGLGGNDRLTGGFGDDDFTFVLGTGKDVVTDFGLGDDEIRLFSLKGLKDFDDMIAHHVEEKANGDTSITYGHDTIVLKGVHAADLHSENFVL